MHFSNSNLLRLKTKPTTLLSLYGSSITSLLCVITEEFRILIISRPLIGAYIGLNLAVYRNLIFERASSQAAFQTIILCSSLVFSCGGAWIPTLGYFFLDSVGWMKFLLMTSLPVFLPAVFILHLCSFDDQVVHHQLQSDTESDTAKVNKVPNIKIRLVKASIFNFTVWYKDWGTILLFPALLQQYNQTQTGGSHCNAAVRGPELLFLALVNGAALAGKSSANLFSGLVSWRLVSVSLAAVSLSSYTSILLNQSTFMIMLVMSVLIKIASGMNMFYTENISYDERYFGTRYLSLASAITLGAGITGGMLGITIVSMATPPIAVLCAMVISGVEVLATLSMYEQDQL